MLASGCSPEEDIRADQSPTEAAPGTVDISLRYEPGKRYLSESEISARPRFTELPVPAITGGQEMRQTHTQKIALSVLKENPWNWNTPPSGSLWI